MEDLEKKPDNFLVWAILTTVLCCLPTGIMAIVYANKVDPLWFAGRKDEALKAAEDAKAWTFLSLGAGVASNIIYFVILLKCWQWAY